MNLRELNCKKIYLCTPDNQIVTVLNGVRTETVDFHAQVKGYSELSFTVDRFVRVDGQLLESNGYEDLKVYMNLYLEDIGYFQIQEPTVISDGAEETKDVVAYSAEKEFESKDWKGVKINCGTSDSIEYLYEDNIDTFGFAKRYVVMYDADDTRFSFLSIIIDKMGSKWKAGHIDPRIRKAQIPNIEIENENLYAVMTSEVAPRLSCIFVFDYLNYTINVYHKDSLDFDTGIFIGFRNLAQKVDVSVNQDSIFTRFSVAGANDLNLRYQNYGSDQIFNLDYFLGEPYMDEDTVTKYRQYVAFRDKYKDAYLAVVKDMLTYQSKIYDLTYTVPSDELAWKNWNDMNEEGLQENLAYYNSLLESFQIVVDDRPNDVKYTDYGTPEQKYNPILNNQGEVDHEWYLNELYAQMGVYSGYYTYKDIHEYILPYIELALENIERVKNGQEPYTPEDKDMDNPTENWDLYGYEELDGVRKSYEEDLTTKLTRYSKPWDSMTPEERIENNLNFVSEEEYEASYQRKLYVHYMECLGDKDNPAEGTIYYRLQELKREIDENQEALDNASATIAEYNNIMLFDIRTTEWYEDGGGSHVPYTHLSQEILDERNGILFTYDEIELINILFHDTDYTNSNIFTTSLDDLYTTLDRQKELYDDATEKLIEVSQPQYTFSVSLDNLLRLTEYETWYEDFQLLRFIRLGIHDDYSTKLRIIGYRWNPCEVTPDLQIEFSNMITGKSGRSDLVQLLELENNSGSKNSISIGTGNSKSDQEYVSKLIQVLAQNSIFTKTISNIAGGTTGQTDTAAVQNIISDFIQTLHLNADSINVGNITGTTAQFEEVFTKYLSSDEIYTKFIQMDAAKVGDLQARLVTSDQVIAGLVNAQEGSFDNLDADNAFIKHLESTLITASEIQVDDLKAKLAQIDVADIEELYAGNAFIESLQTLASTSATSVIDDAYIYNAVANKISVADLAAGNIVLTDNMKILSQNGKMVMNGTALQIMGKDKNNNDYVGIQLGYDASSNPSLILRNESGATILTPDGITSDAIADQLIINNMIKDGTISENKLGFNVMKQGDTVTIEQIYLGDKQFGAEWTNFTNGTNDALDELSQRIDDTANYDLYIEAPNGTNIWGGNVTLNVKLFKNNVDVTDEYDASCFVWTRKSHDHDADIYWNSNHSNGEKVLTITANDVRVNADFQCRFEYENITITSV